eukprot:snap_masked-scaffold_29-processed-gene-2.65-mRNA-1 protein AED:1.00 eAED:1.00 QI:0/-1/0/0/-1/1/1/0/902
MKSYFIFSAVTFLVRGQEEECVGSGQQCGGSGFSGPTSCCNADEACNFEYPFYSECGKPVAECQPRFSQCGGEDYTGETSCCDVDTICQEVSSSYSECQPIKWDLLQEDCGLVETGSDPYQNVSAVGYAWDNGQLSVEGTQLVNEAGEPIQLKGMVASNFPEPNCNDLCTYSYVVTNWGVNLLRLPIAAWYLEQDSERAMQEYMELIDSALDLGVYVMASFQNTQPSPFYFINEVQNMTVVEFWITLAERYGNNTQFMIDLMDEPSSGNWEEGWQEMVDFAEEIIPTIRESAPDTVILVPTNFWNQNFHVVATNVLSDEVSDNVMYKAHFYVGSHDIYLARLVKYASRVPMFVAKLGISEWFGEGFYPDFISKYIEEMAKLNISWAYSAMTGATDRNAIWNEGVCESHEFTNLSCTGVYMKDMFVNGEFPVQEAVTGNQCGGFGFHGPQKCAEETDTCVVVNETYSECQSLGFVCKESFAQCGGVDAEGNSVRSSCCHEEDICTEVTDAFSHCVPSEISSDYCDSNVEFETNSALGFATQHGALSVVNNRIVDENGAVVQLRGITLPIITVPQLSECSVEDIMATAVSQWGINTLRIPLSVQFSAEPSSVQYLLDQVAVCDNLSVYCVVSLYFESCGNPINYVEESTLFWGNVTSALGDKTNIIYELNSKSFGSDYDLEDFYNLRSFAETFMNTFRSMESDAVVILGLSNGFDVYMPHAEHIDSGFMINVVYGATFYAGSDRDVSLIEDFNIHSDRRAMFVSEFHFTGEDSDALYPLSSQRLLDILNLKSIGYISSPVEDLLTSCTASTLNTNCLGSILRTSVEASIEAAASEGDSEDGNSPSETESSDDDDDVYESLTIVFGAVAVALLLVLLSSFKKKEPNPLESAPAEVKVDTDVKASL